MDTQTRWATLRRRRVLFAAITGIVVLGAVLAATFLHGSAQPQPVAYTNISRNFKTCLLSTPSEATAATPVWSAIQAAARQVPINAQHITAPTGATDDVLPYFNSLLALHCQLIVTAGDDLHAPLAATATHNPTVAFLNIGTPLALANVHTITPSATVAADVTAYVLAAAQPRHASATP